MPEIFVGTPMFGGVCQGTYAISLFQMVPTFMNAGVGLRFGYNMNHSLVTRARDDLVADFMPTASTHLMFIDADIGFDPKDVLSMVAADKDVVCGLYPRKEINWQEVVSAVADGVPQVRLGDHTGRFVVNTLPGEPVVEQYSTLDDPFEVLNAGTGFMLIKRRVLDVLSSVVPQYQAGGRQFREFFGTAVVDGEFLSEDWNFCRLARAAGFKVWVDPSVRLTHTGAYVFEGRLS